MITDDLFSGFSQIAPTPPKPTRSTSLNGDAMAVAIAKGRQRRAQVISRRPRRPARSDETLSVLWIPPPPPGVTGICDLAISHTIVLGHLALSLFMWTQAVSLREGFH